MLVSGIAGGLHPDLTIGTILVPEAVLDLGSGQRYESSPMEGIQREGLIASADHLIMDEDVLAGLQEQGVVAMEMESSGVAAACQDAGVPWTTFRVISDRPDDGLTDDAIMSLLRPDGVLGRGCRTAPDGAAPREGARHGPARPRLLDGGVEGRSERARRRSAGNADEGSLRPGGLRAGIGILRPSSLKCPGMLRLSGALGSVASGPRRRRTTGL